MENKTSPGYDNLEAPGNGISGQARQYPDTPSPLHCQGNSADDIFLEDFTQEECFILNEEYVLLEGEYVMWEGTIPCNRKNSLQSVTDVFEEESLYLPEDESLHHLNEYFTLRTHTRPHSHR